MRRARGLLFDYARDAALGLLSRQRSGTVAGRANGFLIHRANYRDKSVPNGLGVARQLYHEHRLLSVHRANAPGEPSDHVFPGARYFDDNRFFGLAAVVTERRLDREALEGVSREAQNCAFIFFLCMRYAEHAKTKTIQFRTSGSGT